MSFGCSGSYYGQMRFRLELCLCAVTLIAFAQNDRADAFKLHGDHAIEAGNYHQAELDFTKALQANPKSVDLHHKLAQSLMLQAGTGPIDSPANLERVQKAIELLRAAADVTPAPQSLLFDLAYAQGALARALSDPAQAREQFQAAVESARRTVDANPKDNEARFLLANIESSMTWHGIESAGAPRQTEAGQPPFLVEPGQRSNLRAAYGKYVNDALLQCERTIDSDPNYGLAMLQAFIAYQLRASLDNSDAALRDLDSALAMQQRYLAAAKTATPETARQILGALIGPVGAMVPQAAGTISGPTRLLIMNGVLVERAR